MSFRDAIKTGGGFLNNVDGEFKGYEFADRFKGEKAAGEWIYFVPQIHVDGADEPVDQHLFFGSAKDYEISKDGLSVTRADGSNVTFGGKTPFGRFLISMLDAAEKANVDLESELPDLSAGEALNLEALIGKRFRFKQEVDEAGTKKFGKRTSGAGKNKREYDRTNTVIEAVLGEAKGSSKSGKPSSKKAAKDDDEDLDTEAADVLKDVLAKGPIKRNQLALPVTKALMKNDNKDALKKIILDEDWQDSQDWLTVDKKGNLSVED